MHRFLILGALGLAVGGLGVTRFRSLEERLADLDDFRRATPRVVSGLCTDQADLELRVDDLADALGQIERNTAEGELDENELRAQLAEMSGMLRSALSTLQEQQVVLSSQASALEDLEARHAQWVGRDIDARVEILQAGVEALEAGLAGRYEALSDVVRSAVTLAEDARTEIDVLRHQTDSSDPLRWEDMMGPTVQLSGDSTVGSGVLLRSRPLPEGGYETLLLTAWHVVRDIRSESSNPERPIPITVYERGGILAHETATLLRHDAALDVALLRLDSKRPMPNGVRLASRERLRQVQVFEEVVAVGCPLGNDPIPTRGEVAELNHRVDGNRYWMISAPTYIGNSGGGIFDARSHELIGIFSKIYTHGSLRPTVVPHMGLITPLERVYDWLEGQGVARVDDGATFVLAQAEIK